MVSKEIGFGIYSNSDGKSLKDFKKEVMCPDLGYNIAGCCVRMTMFPAHNGHLRIVE